LQRIVNLVGVEALSSEQRWTLEAAGLIKEGLLQQSAIDEVDSFASPEKQYALLAALLEIPPGHETGEARRAGARD
jgi:V/A-type H+/Na+-transporting ATPase subunit A